MFEGVQDQFHQFLTAPNPSSSSPHHPDPIPLPPPQPPPLSFSLLHGRASSSSPSPSNSFPSLVFHHDPFNPVQTHLHHHQNLHQLHGFLSPEGERLRKRSLADSDNNLIDSASWSHDELLALLKIRSALENWFPEFTWEHVSRKLSELGFKRSPQKCKEKFEEESGSYHNNDVTGIETDVTKNYRLFSELEELCHHGHGPPPPPHHHHHLHQQPTAMISPRHENQADANADKQNPQTQAREQGEMQDGGDEQELGQEETVHDKMGRLERSLDTENDCSDAIDKMEEHQATEAQQGKKPRRPRDQIMNNDKKFELFKSFCEEIVDKMMSQQEELQNKILQDMIKRDEEKFAREESWRIQEMERLNKEIDARAKDFAFVSQRQAQIIDFLKKISTHKNDASNETPKPTHQNPSSSATQSNDGSISQTSNTNPNSTAFRKPRPKRPRKESCSEGNDIGKRWQREEVLALINIRCNLDFASKTGPDDLGQTNNKNSPLWERISHKMMEKGYNRSSKRCKEKWENINKYFRKTKDISKDRSVDSRTCPYFHQLNHLYSQGRVAGEEGGDGADEGGSGMNNVEVNDRGEDGGHV